MSSGETQSGPVIPIYAHQRPILQDKSRLIAWVKSRQVGGSFTATLKIVLDAIETGEDWNTMSRSQRQAEKLLLKASKHVLAINKYITQVLKGAPIVDLTRISSQRIVLANGATIEAVPCDPDTTTGDTVNWLLDEFGLFPKSERIFGVIKPSIMLGKRMMVVSTPRGRRGKFFQLHEQFERLGRACGWSWHNTTIEDAIRGGFCPRDEENRPLTFERFRDQEIRDVGEEMFNQEYMCVFSDKLTSFLPYKLVTACQAANLPLVRTVEAFASFTSDLYVGMDIGRLHDLSVIWVLTKTGDQYTTLAVFALDGMPYEEQERILGQILATRKVAACYIDRFGIGHELTERMTKIWPGIVEGIAFTNPLKAEMAYRVKVAMESGNWFMPADAELRDDFASIERDITDSGLMKLAAPRTSGGHGDRFWAAALAAHAAATHRPFQLVMAM